MIRMLGRYWHDFMYNVSCLETHELLLITLVVAVIGVVMMKSAGGRSR